MTNQPKSSIFFHMGPGANAEVEEQLLSAKYPEMLFWNQPLQKNSLDAFTHLISEAEKKVAALVQENGVPINVMAHSFGGHIFHQLTLKHPEYFSSCTMLGTGYDVVAGFYKLLKKVASDSGTPAPLQNKISEYLNTQPAPSKEELWNYVGLIAQDPAFFRLYWADLNLFNKYLPLASVATPMDMESFQNILNDFLKNYYSPANPIVSPWAGNVEIVFGENDPLIYIDHETTIWKKIFPAAQMKVLKNSGHYIHLEKILNT